MLSHDRRACTRRRSLVSRPGLRIEPLEGRPMMAAGPATRPDLVATNFDTIHNLDWDDSFHARGVVLNQGRATTQVPFRIDIYASTTQIVGSDSVYLGSAVIPAGLAPGATAAFDQQVTLPATPIPNVDGTGLIFVNLKVNPDGKVNESNRANNQSRGQGADTSVVYIIPRTPADLVGRSLGVFPDRTTWGGTIAISTQIQNNSAGDAPATRAKVVLTPVGTAPGGPADVLVADLEVPALSPYQSTNVVGNVVLPQVAPSTLSATDQFTLSLVTDADFVLNKVGPHVADQGPGLDTARVTIAANPAPDPAALAASATRADLAPANVVLPSTSMSWGDNLQGTTTIQNLGQADAGPFQVRFYLTGADSNSKLAIALGTALVPGLQAGNSLDVTQALKIPGRLPAGTVLSSVSTGRIIAVVDPDNTIDEINPINNTTTSGPITFRVPGRDANSTVPTLGEPTVASSRPAVVVSGTSNAPPTPGAPAPSAAETAAAIQAANQANTSATDAAVQQATITTSGVSPTPSPATRRKLRRKATPRTDKSIGKKITSIPGNVRDFFKDLVN